MRVNNLTLEGNRKGGFANSQKIYYCEVCNGIGRNSGMVTNHLEGCKGMGRKLKKATEMNQHRLQEAMINTRGWKANKLVEETKQMLAEFQADAIRDIDNIKEINREVMEDMIVSYYTQLF